MHSVMSRAAQEQAWNTTQLLQPVLQPLWRVWTYNAPAVVLGCAQNTWYDDVTRRAPPGVACVKREAGGGAVLTGPCMVSASVVLPVDHPWLRGGLLDSYRALGELHALVLQQHGIAAQVLTAQDVAAAKQGRHANAPAWACFGGLSHGEVVNAEGRKLVGLAQRRRRNGVLLVAGTLVSRVPWTLLCTALGHPQDEALLAGCTVSMEESLGQPCASAAVAAQLDRQLRSALQAA